jgi:hypothetical protein
MVALWSLGGPSCALQAACARDSSGVRACLRAVSCKEGCLFAHVRGPWNRSHTRQQSQQQQPRHARRQKNHRICTQKFNAPVLAACAKKEATGHQERRFTKNFSKLSLLSAFVQIEPCMCICVCARCSWCSGHADMTTPWSFVWQGCERGRRKGA